MKSITVVIVMDDNEKFLDYSKKVYNELKDEFNVSLFFVGDIKKYNKEISQIEGYCRVVSFFSKKDFYERLKLVYDDIVSYYVIVLNDFSKDINFNKIYKILNDEKPDFISIGGNDFISKKNCFNYYVENKGKIDTELFDYIISNCLNEIEEKIVKVEKKIVKIPVIKNTDTIIIDEVIEVIESKTVEKEKIVDNIYKSKIIFGLPKWNIGFVNTIVNNMKTVDNDLYIVIIDENKNILFKNFNSSNYLKEDYDICVDLLPGKEISSLVKCNKNIESNNIIKTTDDLVMFLNRSYRLIYSIINENKIISLGTNIKIDRNIYKPLTNRRDIRPYHVLCYYDKKYNHLINRIFNEMCLRDDRVRLILYSDNDYVSGISNTIKWESILNPTCNHISSIYASSSCFLNLSDSVFHVLESMACGCPVVSIDGPYIGLVYNDDNLKIKKDENKIREDIYQFLQDKNISKEYINRGLNTISDLKIILNDNRSINR